MIRRAKRPDRSPPRRSCLARTSASGGSVRSSRGGRHLGGRSAWRPWTRSF